MTVNFCKKMPKNGVGDSDTNDTSSTSTASSTSSTNGGNIENLATQINTSTSSRSQIDKLQCGSLLKKVLKNRGINTKEHLNELKNPTLDNFWTDNPYGLEGLEQVVNRIELTIKQNKRILVYGDYDLDGISSTVVMLRGLGKLIAFLNSNSTLDYFIASRLNEGYGLSEKSIERMLLEKEMDLIVTVDCGISSCKEIATLQERGIEVVVTDHHELSASPLDDVPFVDPKVTEGGNKSHLDTDTNAGNLEASALDGVPRAGKNAILAGVGVALKVIQALYSRNGMPHEWRNLTDIATLGTVADMMPLVGQNRALVVDGLKKINSRPRACIKALLDLQRKGDQELSAYDLSFSLIPWLNSAGRMDRTDVAVDLLLSDDYSECYNLASQLEQINALRRQKTDEVQEQAILEAKSVIKNNPQVRCLCLAAKDWHKGVIGIAAAKVSEVFNMPTILFTLEDGLAHGSGRSVGQIDLHGAVLEQMDLLERFGGHKKAIGLTLREENLGQFSDNLNEIMKEKPDFEFEKKVEYDAVAGLHELDMASVKELALLEPCGMDNEYPVFLVKNVFLKSARAIGKDKNHLMCQISDGAYGAQAVKFNCNNISEILACDEVFYVAFKPKIDEWRGRQSVKLYVEELAPSGEVIRADFNQRDGFCKHMDEFFEHEIGAGNVGSSGKNAEKSAQPATSANAEKSARATVQDGTGVSDDNFEQSARDTAQKNPENQLTERRKHWEALAHQNPQGVRNEIVRAMIGDGQLHDSQEETLELLSEGKSVLTVMPTGRGKSLIFQVYAALLALSEGKMSVFVYPLRALIADQAFHLNRVFGKFGLRCLVLTGETNQAERQEVYAKMRVHEVDIVLTTPEFLDIHKAKFAENAQVGFLVIDECHHIGQVKVGQRSAYGGLREALALMGDPQVLALSATVNKVTAADVKKFLPIEQVVSDDFCRDNLYVDDRRNIKSRDDYLTSIVASGQKTVIYVNSREQTVALARMLRSRAQHVALGVGFYNAGMSKAQRKMIEEMFRDGKLCTLIATSAFGEGVNIPDVRHVVLYHLPFSDVEFNQMSGRAGRDGAPALIHLLYNRGDASINSQILDMSNPGREILGGIYLWLKSLCEVGPAKTYEMRHQKLPKLFEIGACPGTPEAVLCALDVFDELGLIEVETRLDSGNKSAEGAGSSPDAGSASGSCDAGSTGDPSDAENKVSVVTLVDVSKKVRLEDSSRFVEGQNEIFGFQKYKNNAMRQSAHELQEALRRPILPG